MARKNDRAHSPLAKANAAFDADMVKIYPDHPRDCAKYGQRTADFNAGFLDGDANGRADLARLVKPVLEDPSGRVTGKWSRKQRRDWDRVYTKLEQAIKAG